MLERTTKPEQMEKQITHIQRNSGGDGNSVGRLVMTVYTEYLVRLFRVKIIYTIQHTNGNYECVEIANPDETLVERKPNGMSKM